MASRTAHWRIPPKKLNWPLTHLTWTHNKRSPDNTIPNVNNQPPCGIVMATKIEWPITAGLRTTIQTIGIRVMPGRSRAATIRHSLRRRQHLQYRRTRHHHLDHRPNRPRRLRQVAKPRPPPTHNNSASNKWKKVDSVAYSLMNLNFPHGTTKQIGKTETKNTNSIF